MLTASGRRVMGLSSHAQYLVSCHNVVSSFSSSSTYPDCVDWKGKEEYLYSAFYILHCMYISKRSGMDHTFLPANTPMPAFPS